MIKRITLFPSFFLLLLIPAITHAYTFSPSVATITSSGHSTSCLFSISNPDDRIIPIDITIYELTKDIDGEPIEGREIIDDFIIYPSQFLLKPKARRSVQVRWVGDASIPYGRAFKILCREIPLPKTDRAKPKEVEMSASINILLNYAGRIYVVPQGAKPEIVIDSVETRRNEADRLELVITCKNQGTRDGKLLNAKFIVSPADSRKEDTRKSTSVVLTLKDIPGLASSIFANSSRRFVIPWPKNLPIGPVNVSLEQGEY
jgi:fimbrial chaperone protein